MILTIIINFINPRGDLIADIVTIVPLNLSVTRDPE